MESRRRREEEEGSLRTRLRCPSCGNVEREGGREGGREARVVMDGCQWEGHKPGKREIEEERVCRRAGTRRRGVVARKADVRGVCTHLGIGCWKEGVQCLQGLVGQVRRDGRDKHLDSGGILYTHACKRVCVVG